MARIYEAIEGVLLPLGRRGENEALEVRVNIKQWVADYGNGAFGGLAQRYGEDEPYPVTITTDGDFACWLVTDVDTAIEGCGKFELDYIVGGVLAKSVVWRTKVQPSVAEPGPVPDPYESWVEDVLAAGASVLNKIDKVAGATAGTLPQLEADGTLAPTSIPAAKVMKTPSAATEGNLAAWDDALGVIDSGVAASTVPGLVSGKMNAYKSIDPALTPDELKDSFLVGFVGGRFQEIYADGSHWRLGIYSVRPGDQLRISGYAGSSANTPLYVFTDSGGQVVERYWTKQGADSADVIVPDGAAILCANGNRDVESWVAPYEIVTDFDAASEEVCGSMEVKLVENPENPAERGGVVVTSGDWEIDWGRNGWNNLPNLRSILFQGKPAYIGNTDFIGPYAFAMDDPGIYQGDYDWGGVAMFTTGGGHTFFDDRYTVINAYIVGDSDTKDSGWLSLTAGGAPLTPQTGYTAYFIVTAGDYRGVSYIWDGSNYVLPAHPPTKNEGVRTARCISIKFYADGEELTADSGIVHCDTFRMVWRNRIQASNTIRWATRTPGPDGEEPENYDIPENYSAGKECIEECGWVEFTGGGMIRCGVTFKPLASIHMGWYSGMQAQIHYLYDPDNDAPRHFDANTAKMCYIEQWSHELMEWARVTNDVTIGGVTYPSYAGDDHSVISDATIIGKYASLDMHMDRDYGVARLRWDLDAPQNHYFYTGAGTNMKGYMLLVRRDYRNPWPMPLGTLWPWRGYYHFRPTDIDRSGLIN